MIFFYFPLRVFFSQIYLTSCITEFFSLQVLKEDIDNNGSNSHHQSSPSPSYSPTVSSPYMHPHHYRYDQRMQNTGGTSFEKRPLPSPNEILQESVRASVLRDGSKAAGRPGSPGPLSLSYRASSSNLPGQPEADAPSENRFNPDQATALICPESNTSDQCQDPGCPEGTDKSCKKNYP